MDQRFIATIDQGTTGTRFAIFNKDGDIVAYRYAEHRQIYPNPGWVEHDPAEIWQKTQRVIRDALNSSRIDPREIAAIGVTNQRETTVVWDIATGKPYCNAIVWQCTRTRKICNELKAKGLEPTIRDKTGLYNSTYFSGPKIKWILDNVPDVREAAEENRAVFGNMDSWIMWNLTGGPTKGSHITDYTNASRTMLMELKSLQWDDEIIEELDIPSQMLPEIRPSSEKETYGHTPKDGIFRVEIPICGDVGDQQAALIGQTCFEKGETKNTYGTGCFMLMNTGEKPIASKHGLITTCAYGFEANKCVYALEGSVAIAGAAIQWLRDNLKIIRSASETGEIAKSVSEEGSGGVFFVPAFSGLFAPYWDMNARGCIIGITRYTKREHLVHAALEAICYQSRDVLEAMMEDSGIRISELKVDGGAVVNNYLMQLQSDILGLQVVRPTVNETTSLGAAYSAGLAAGFWEDIDEIKRNWKVARIFNPKWSDERRLTMYTAWRRAVERSMRWVKD
ncbi:MAG: glycerol kinase GlpK [Candidatus Bathyarchaeota archaeon]|nr:glycerol kinase GlpK [Candidatus Bathyarchaeota archaeon]